MVESTKDETWEVWLRKWIAALSPVATLIAAVVAVIFVAQPQLQVSQDIGRRQLRAYVHVTRVRITSVDSQAIGALATIENLGLTPARELTYFYSFSPRFSNPDIEKDRGGGGAGRLSNPVIASKQSQTLAVSLSLSDAEFEAMRVGQATISLTGSLSYEDTFRVRHSTNFDFTLAERMPAVGDELEPMGTKDDD